MTPQATAMKLALQGESQFLKSKSISLLPHARTPFGFPSQAPREKADQSQSWACACWAFPPSLSLYWWLIRTRQPWGAASAVFMGLPSLPASCGLHLGRELCSSTWKRLVSISLNVAGPSLGTLERCVHKFQGPFQAP